MAKKHKEEKHQKEMHETKHESKKSGHTAKKAKVAHKSSRGK